MKTILDKAIPLSLFLLISSENKEYSLNYSEIYIFQAMEVSSDPKENKVNIIFPNQVINDLYVSGQYNLKEEITMLFSQLDVKKFVESNDINPILAKYFKSAPQDSDWIFGDEEVIIGFSMPNEIVDELGKLGVSVRHCSLNENICAYLMSKEGVFPRDKLKEFEDNVAESDLYLSDKRQEELSPVFLRNYEKVMGFSRDASPEEKKENKENKEKMNQQLKKDLSSFRLDKAGVVEIRMVNYGYLDQVYSTVEFSGPEDSAEWKSRILLTLRHFDYTSKEILIAFGTKKQRDTFVKLIDQHPEFFSSPVWLPPDCQRASEVQNKMAALIGRMAVPDAVYRGGDSFISDKNIIGSSVVVATKDYLKLKEEIFNNYVSFAAIPVQNSCEPALQQDSPSKILQKLNLQGVDISGEEGSVEIAVSLGEAGFFRTHCLNRTPSNEFTRYPTEIIKSKL